jgi:hypothetical protein
MERWFSLLTHKLGGSLCCFVQLLLLCGPVIIDVKVMHRALSTLDVILEYFRTTWPVRNASLRNTLQRFPGHATFQDPAMDPPRADMNDHGLNPIIRLRIEGNFRIISDQ